MADDAKPGYAKGRTGKLPGTPKTPGSGNERIPRTPANAARICEMIVQGKALNEVAHAMGAAGKSTILMWVAQDANFAEQYRLAKIAQMDAFAEQVVEIADDSSDDWIKREGQRGTVYQVVDKEAVLRSKLRVDTRLRLMSMYAPKRFGPKIEVEHDVSDAFAERLVRARERLALASKVIDGEATVLADVEAA